MDTLWYGVGMDTYRIKAMSSRVLVQKKVGRRWVGVEELHPAEYNEAREYYSKLGKVIGGYKYNAARHAPVVAFGK